MALVSTPVSVSGFRTTKNYSREVARAAWHSPNALLCLNCLARKSTSPSSLPLVSGSRLVINPLFLTSLPPSLHLTPSPLNPESSFYNFIALLSIWSLWFNVKMGLILGQVKALGGLVDALRRGKKCRTARGGCSLFTSSSDRNPFLWCPF